MYSGPRASPAGVSRRTSRSGSGETGARWAAAARNPAKVETVLGEAGVSAPETIVAEVDDAGSLVRMASRARVVLNLVGPYTTYGRPVIEACVAGGAHYVDLTGEIPFVRQIIDAFDARAAGAGSSSSRCAGSRRCRPTSPFCSPRRRRASVGARTSWTPT